MKSNYNLFKSTLDFFRIGLKLAVLEKEEIAQWADSCLLNNCYLEQQHIIAELALVKEKSTKELSAFISGVIGIETTILGNRLFLSRLYQIADLEKIMPTLKGFIKLMNLPELEEEAVRNLYYEPNFGIPIYPSTQEEILETQKKAIHYLKIYADFRLEKLAQLELIEKAFQKK